MDKLTNTENVGWRPKPNATQPLRWSEKSSLPELIETSQPWANPEPTLYPGSYLRSPPRPHAIVEASQLKVVSFGCLTVWIIRQFIFHKAKFQKWQPPLFKLFNLKKRVDLRFLHKNIRCPAGLSGPDFFNYPANPVSGRVVKNTIRARLHPLLRPWLGIHLHRL